MTNTAMVALIDGWTHPTKTQSRMMPNGLQVSKML